MIDECTPGRLLKKKEAEVYSTDDGNKHIQGTEFKMASLGEEIMLFALSGTVKLGLMGEAVCVCKWPPRQTPPGGHGRADVHNITVLQSNGAVP